MQFGRNCNRKVGYKTLRYKDLSYNMKDATQGAYFRILFGYLANMIGFRHAMSAL